LTRCSNPTTPQHCEATREEKKQGEEEEADEEGRDERPTHANASVQAHAQCVSNTQEEEEKKEEEKEEDAGEGAAESLFCTNVQARAQCVSNAEQQELLPHPPLSPRDEMPRAEAASTSTPTTQRKGTHPKEGHKPLPPLPFPTPPRAPAPPKSRPTVTRLGASPRDVTVAQSLRATWIGIESGRAPPHAPARLSGQFGT